MSRLLQSTLLSLENNLLQLNIKQNLLSEKTARILDLTKSLVCFLDLQPKVDFARFERSQFGLSTATKNFEQSIRQDLQLISDSRQIVLREWKIRSQLDQFFQSISQMDSESSGQNLRQRRHHLKHFADLSVQNVGLLQNNLKTIVHNQVKSLQDFMGECRRSARGLGLILKCLGDLQSGESFV